MPPKTRNAGGARAGKQPAQKPATKTRAAKKRAKRQESPPPTTTDPTGVKKPADGVHPRLRRAFAIETHNDMCFLFDSVSPARQFKIGSKYTDEDPFADYGPPPYGGSITETDDDNVLQPFYPIEYEQQFYFAAAVKQEDFMEWFEDEVRQLAYKKRNPNGGPDPDWTVVKIPAAYLRLISQLTMEITHGQWDPGHESLRRESYASRTLDELGDELVKYNGPPEDFRSKILTPILQRQLQAVPDCYTPSVRHAIAPRTNTPTLEQVTQFYLGDDPLDSGYIPSYRRSAIYFSEIRWHLAIIMGRIDVKSVFSYNKFLNDTDLVFSALEIDPHDNISSSQKTVADVESAIPVFTAAEVRLLVEEELEDFFAEELERVPELYKLAKQLQGGLSAPPTPTVRRLTTPARTPSSSRAHMTPPREDDERRLTPRSNDGKPTPPPEDDDEAAPPPNEDSDMSISPGPSRLPGDDDRTAPPFNEDDSMNFSPPPSRAPSINPDPDRGSEKRRRRSSDVSGDGDEAGPGDEV